MSDTQLYGFGSGWQGSELKSSCDTVLNQCSSYGYDEFGRLTSFNVNQGPPGSFTYTYDRWGNRWQQNALNGGPHPQLSFNTSTNQITNSVYGYDAAGNLTSDGNNGYTYDDEGNVKQVSGASTATYTYDALNQRVRVDQPSSSEEFIFNPAGQHTSSRDVINNWEWTGWMYWGAKPVAFYGMNVTNFEHQDWLGTERVRTTYNGQQVEGSFTSLPFGDGYSANGSDWDPYDGIETAHYGRFASRDSSPLRNR